MSFWKQLWSALLWGYLNKTELVQHYLGHGTSKQPVCMIPTEFAPTMTQLDQVRPNQIKLHEKLFLVLLSTALLDYWWLLITR